MQVTVSLVLVIAVAAISAVEEFKEELVWRSLDFTWPDDGTRAAALGRSEYQPENNALSGIRVWKGRIFVTVPRWKRGVPATLAIIPEMARRQPSPPLQPFPNWEMQMLGNCSALQSVQALEVDLKDQVWVLDNGRVFTMTTSPENRCPPKVVLFDLQGTLLKIFPIPDSALSHNKDSELVGLALDTDDTLYISDASATDPGIVVFDTWNNRATKVSDATMQGDPGWRGPMLSQLNVNGLALSPVPPSAKTNPGANRTLYYAPLASDKLFAVSTHALRNEALHHNIRTFISDLGNKSSFGQALSVDSRAILYLGLAGMDTIARWDTRKLPLEQNLHMITKDAERMRWPSALALDDSGSLWVISNRLDSFQKGSVNLNEVNYRIMKAVTNSSSYQFPEESADPPPPTVPYTISTSTSSTLNMTTSTTPEPHSSTTNTTTGAAESLARPSSVVLAILATATTFLMAC